MLRSDITRPLNAKPASLRCSGRTASIPKSGYRRCPASIRAHDQACHAGMFHQGLLDQRDAQRRSSCVWNQTVAGAARFNLFPPAAHNFGAIVPVCAF
jgi:hypothetical protein